MTLASTVQKYQRTNILVVNKPLLVMSCERYANHVLKPRWRELRHHCLRECIVRCLKETKDNVISPVKTFTYHSCKYRMEHIPELPISMKAANRSNADSKNMQTETHLPKLRRPYPNYTPQRNHARNHTCHQKLVDCLERSPGDTCLNTHHLLRTDLPVFLNIPEPHSAYDRCDSLSEAEIRDLQERK
jgi:hypothetical protein